jgi:phospholipase/carboxylesterase
MTVSRRTILAGFAAGLASAQVQANRLSARPGSKGGDATAGLHPLELLANRDSLLYIPESAKKYEKAPLVVSLHGATRTADRAIDLLRSLADELGFLLLAPQSIGRTWDVVGGDYGPDIEMFNRALHKTFEMRRVDPASVAIAGFSDGASYSLSVGLSNGDLFHTVIAFSPGFIVPAQRVGKPAVFISHGTVDQILPIDDCSRRIVPKLKRDGYDVTYREFEGKHTVPPEIAAEAMRWFLDKKR